MDLNEAKKIFKVEKNNNKCWRITGLLKPSNALIIPIFIDNLKIVEIEALVDFSHNPFVQAKTNFYSLSTLVDKLSNGFIRLDKYVYGTLVSFSDLSQKINFGPKSNGVDVLYKNDNIFEFIKTNSIYLTEADHRLRELTNEMLEKIVKVLDGSDFVYSKSPSEYIETNNLCINKLTSSQETILDGLLENDHCLITGRAGTGKTILCQFLFKKLTLERKLSVIYFTFNEMIARSINKNIQMTNNSACYPIFNYFEEEYKRISGNNVPVFNSFDEKKDFLFKNINHLLENSYDVKKYDCIIIDEAQDIDGSDEMYNILDNMLNEGFENSKCYLFYDDEQNIFNKRNKVIYERDEFKEYHYTKYRLNINCRNNEYIHGTVNNVLERKVNSLTDLSIKESENVSIETITLDEIGVCKLINRINGFLAKGVAKGQITILFNRKVDNSNKILKYLLNKYGYSLKPYAPGERSLTYSTIARFKGLENDIIIYINDNQYSNAIDHYVAISRAKSFCNIYVAR